MSSYAEHFTRHLRLTILQILTQASGYSANDSVIAMSAEGMGLQATRDRIRTELVWLEEQQLLRREEPASGVVVATITERGADVSSGRAACPGVQRPSPRG